MQPDNKIFQVDCYKNTYKLCIIWKTFNSKTLSKTKKMLTKTKHKTVQICQKIYKIDHDGKYFYGQTNPKLSCLKAVGEE